MESEKTHRELKDPQVSARYLADFMAASEQLARSIIRRCKYQGTAPVIQHKEARLTVSKFIREGKDLPVLARYCARRAKSGRTYLRSRQTRQI